MILTCSACKTRYMVDPAAIGPRGRTVKCAKCGHQWAQPPAPPELRAESVKLTRPPAAAVAATRAQTRNLPGFPVQRQPRGVVAAGWAALAAVILALATGTWLGREALVEAWPATTRLYRLVGVAVAVEPPGAGLEVRVLVPRRTVENGIPVLLIEGEVVNVSDTPRPAPQFTATLRDHDDEVVQQWTFSAGVEPLQPQQRVSFQSRFENPSSTATDIKIFFTDFNHSN